MEPLRMPSVPPRRRLVRIYHTVTFEEYDYPEPPTD